MSSPYRETLETVETEESTPSFRPPEQNVLPLAVVTAFVLVLAVRDWLHGRHDSAVVVVAGHLGALSLGAIICLLEKPVRGWLERRYARKVARGIVELEVRASRIGSEHGA